MKCKACGYEGGNQVMGAHYKDQPSHRPNRVKQLMPTLSRISEQRIQLSVEDKIRNLYDEIQSTIKSNDIRIVELTGEMNDLKAENERLQKLSRQIHLNEPSEVAYLAR